MLRRNSFRWITVVALAACTTAIAMPATSSAATSSNDVTYEYVDCTNGLPITVVCPTKAVAGLRYTGWTYHLPAYCPPGSGCVTGGGIDYWTAAAYSWTGSAWRSARLEGGWVYVYPYTGQWRWAWTQATGWVALTGSRFEVRQY